LIELCAIRKYTYHFLTAQNTTNERKQTSSMLCTDSLASKKDQFLKRARLRQAGPLWRIETFPQLRHEKATTTQRKQMSFTRSRVASLPKRNSFEASSLTSSRTSLANRKLKKDALATTFWLPESTIQNTHHETVPQTGILAPSEA